MNSSKPGPTPFGYWHNNQWYALDRDVHANPLSEAEKAHAHNLSAAKFFDPHVGKRKPIPDKRDNSPPREYHLKHSLTADDYRALLVDPVRRARVFAEASAPKSGQQVMARMKACGMPILNADPATTVHAMMHPTPMRHAKDKVVRKVRVKANSMRAAKYNKDWAEHEWHIYSLKYGHGVIIMDHNGNETDGIFPTIGKALAAIKAVDMEIIR